MSRRRLRLLAAPLVAMAAFASWTAVAAAHVTIEPTSAPPGAYTTVSFVVPNERPDAATTKVRVQFPQDHPIGSASVRPVPGWTITVTTKQLEPVPGAEGNQLTEAVDTITWEGGRIGPDQFEAFEVAFGPVPTDATQLYFPAIQTYDSGEEVAWIERPSESEPDPPSPAPELAVSAQASSSAVATDEHGDPIETNGAASPTTAASATQTAAASTTSTESGDASTLAAVGLGVACVALVLGIVALGLALRSRPRSS